MTEKTDILLIKANWCGHCKRFEPIFKNTEAIIKNNDFFKDKNINLKSFDFAENGIKENFENEYGKVSKYIDGFPTVIIRHEKKNNVKYTLIDTAHEDETIKENKRLDHATHNFIKNIKNGYDSLTIQQGGNYEHMLEKTLENELSEMYYKKKYLHYKNKYLELKNK
jgi:thiol-disulfide isomerase/thioredoxin